MLNIKHLNKLKSQMNHQTLIAVTKYVGDDEIEALIQEGITDFGENRVNVFQEKYQKYSNTEITWHFIGHLQSKKVKKMINDIACLHALDRMSLAKEVEKRRIDPLPCFIEVNIANDPNKYGLKKEKVFEFYNKIKDYDKIDIVGFMGMAEHTDDEVIIRKNFQVLVDLKAEFDELYSKSHKLSMGMSNDYNIAIEMGATHLRIGSYLYEEE
ncbi:MAG: YggS family pyridoxal phosphate-dependent enzyme [Tenericutes bacterium]|jgi:pyridoxal phosphate enzyme (YggS family)|nr:YggS family pyridoxal phosphate-dependent enzyme [Mycoplasmatota bacterium]